MPLPTSQLKYPLEIWVSLHFTWVIYVLKTCNYNIFNLKGTIDKALHYIWSFRLFIKALNVSEREKRKYETVHCCFYSDQSHLNAHRTVITTFKLASRNFPGGLYNVTSSYVTVQEMTKQNLNVNSCFIWSFIILHMIIQLWTHMASGWVFNQHTA